MGYIGQIHDSLCRLPRLVLVGLGYFGFTKVGLGMYVRSCIQLFFM
jgi:hypothetical protein